MGPEGQEPQEEQGGTSRKEKWMNEAQVKAVLDGNEKTIRKIYQWQGQASAYASVEGSDVVKSLTYCRQALDASNALIRLLQAEIRGI
jgi:hypothetical protein